MEINLDFEKININTDKTGISIKFKNGETLFLNCISTNNIVTDYISSASTEMIEKILIEGETKFSCFLPIDVIINTLEKYGFNSADYTIDNGRWRYFKRNIKGVNYKVSLNYPAEGYTDNRVSITKTRTI